MRERKLKDQPAIFAQQVRILKALNRFWQMSTDDGRKPLSSFHLTALALAIFAKGEAVPHEEGTPRFLEQAGNLVLSIPVPEPAGVGPDLEASNPAKAAALLVDAGAKTRRALSLPDDEAETLLNEVFGDREQLRALLGEAPIGVTGGRFCPRLPLAHKLLGPSSLSAPTASRPRGVPASPPGSAGAGPGSGVRASCDSGLAVRVTRRGA